MAELNEVLKKRNDEQEDKWATAILGDWLYLGCAKDAKNLLQLRQHKISHILNVSDDVPNYYEAKESPMTYLKLYVQDFGCDKGISRVFQKAFDYISEVKKQGGKVLVHCMQGQNRSVTIVTAYLMNAENMSLKEAICHIRNQKRAACPFRDNREELIRFEASLFGVSSMTVDDFLVSNLHRSHSDGAMINELTSSCCILKKSKTSRGVPPEFLSCSSNSLSMSSSMIPPPSSTSNSHLFLSAPAMPSINDLSNAMSSFSFADFSSQDKNVETITIDVTAADSLSPFPTPSKKPSPMLNSPLLNSSHGSSLRRAQVIMEEEQKDESAGRPRLLVTI